MPGPKFTTRPSGGTRQTVGGFNESKFDEQAMQAAAISKQQSQQQAVKAVGQNKSGEDPGQESSKSGQQKQPRSVGSLKQELIDRPFKDATSELKGLVKSFSPSELLGIDSNNDTPEEIARKKKMHARWQKLTQAEQKVAQEKYQKRLQEKQREQEKQRQKQFEEQQKQQEIAPPSSPQKGPSLTSKKTSKSLAMDQLQRSRQSLGGPGSAN